MKDPAVGRTRSERALGELHPKKDKKEIANPKRTRLEEFRVIEHGQYNGPRPSYGRYNVSAPAADMLNRSKRNMDMR